MSYCTSCLHAYEAGLEDCPACENKLPERVKYDVLTCVGCKYHKPTNGWCDGQFINGPKFKCLNYSKWEAIK